MAHRTNGRILFHRVCLFHRVRVSRIGIVAHTYDLIRRFYSTLTSRLLTISFNHGNTQVNKIVNRITSNSNACSSLIQKDPGRILHMNAYISAVYNIHYFMWYVCLPFFKNRICDKPLGYREWWITCCHRHNIGFVWNSK